MTDNGAVASMTAFSTAGAWASAGLTVGDGVAGEASGAEGLAVAVGVGLAVGLAVGLGVALPVDVGLAVAAGSLDDADGSVSAVPGGANWSAMALTTAPASSSLPALANNRRSPAKAPRRVLPHRNTTFLRCKVGQQTDGGPSATPGQSRPGRRSGQWVRHPAKLKHPVWSAARSATAGASRRRRTSPWPLSYRRHLRRPTPHHCRSSCG